jgi:hypothetical protein
MELVPTSKIPQPQAQAHETFCIILKKLSVTNNNIKIALRIKYSSLIG